MLAAPTDPCSLPFDQYQRYRVAADLIERVRGGRSSLDVLDVGGRSGLLRRFLPRDRVLLVDLEPSDEPGLVVADGSALPFRSGSFDVVAAFDTLEHVPPSRRAAFVGECARVSGGWVFLAGPYRTAEVDEAEELLRSFLAHKLALEHRYLEEHRHNGLPEREQVEEWLRERGARVASIGHGNLERWLALMCMEMYMDADPLLRPIAARFFRFYNQSLYASDHAEPVYRHVVCAALGEAELPGTEGLFAAPVAPPGATRAIGELAGELLAFDREQDVWRPEIARLQGILADLERDLEHHRRSLEDHRRDLEAERQAAARLEEELRTELRTSESVRQETEAHLRRTEESAQKIQEELLRASGDIQGLLAEVRQRDETIGRLQAELRDRWRNFKRAFAPRKPTAP